MRLIILCLWASSFLFFPLQGNPFAINVEANKTLSNEDYQNVQRQLHSLNVEEMLKEMYGADQGYADYSSFFLRCTKGLKQILIDPVKGLYPMRCLRKIGKGGDLCIVTFTPFGFTNEESRTQQSSMDSIVDALEASGFNGCFYYQTGGFPNPTGKEIEYAGVPNSYKIFMMLEARKMGFKKILWMDASLLPLRSPAPFFAWIENTGCFFRGSFTSPSNAREFIFPATLQALQNLTGSDVLNSIYLDTPVFGFKMDTDQAQKLIEEYYRCVEAGTPFLSCFPDGFVLSALLNKPELSLWKPVPCDKLLAPFESENLSPINVERLKKEGYFFAQRSKKLSSN